MKGEGKKKEGKIKINDEIAYRLKKESEGTIS